MSRRQQIFYFTLWREACTAQGWRAGDDERRHAVTEETLGYAKSSKFFSNAEFDRVKRALEALAKPDSISAQIPAVDPAAAAQADERKRILWRIQTFGFTPMYIEKITRDKWAASRMTDLTLPQLNELKITLNNRAHARDKRKVASHAIEQPTLFEQRHAVPEIDRDKLPVLLGILRGRGWMTAKQILLFADAEGWHDDRIIRALAEASDGQVISGQKGYKLTDESTMEEIGRASAWLRSQGNKMINRSIAIDRVYHRRAAA